MIRIDNISFDFVAPDEEFTYGLYGDWDRFCHTCVEEVVEKCLSAYDKRKVLHEIELLDLDLGSIPEEDFYREFPRRLRDELQKALPLLNISTESLEKNTAISRLDNLLFYLEHCYPKAEWADESFSLAEELEWIATQPVVYLHKIAKLCLSKEHALRRLLWQSDNEAIFLRIFVAALSEPAASMFEKRHLLIMYLEVKPEIPVHFVYDTKSDAVLQEMAKLLDTASIRRIMETDAGEHTEVDLPPYWHYLYEWLIRYYPFNGLAIFGSKGDFIFHLNCRLLTFIHKQNHSFYFSKMELTIGFLLEVFGHAYYIDVLNAIYYLQPHHPDGSPVYDSYFNRELYRMFLSLSLLRLPLATGQPEETTVSAASKRMSLHEKEIKRDDIKQIVKQNSNVMKEDYYSKEEQKEAPVQFTIANAGLCLFSPWFSRLFLMLHYLSEDRRTFKDTASKIRAIFLMQYLTCQADKAYQETDLVFNRMLVDLPMHIPLPKQLELTNEEKKIADDMLNGVKSNWDKMRNTSMEGFLQSFITRKGQLEEQDDKWILTVEKRAFDILLDYIPWSYSMIRNPWMKKYIQVNWRNRQ